MKKIIALLLAVSTLFISVTGFAESVTNAESINVRMERTELTVGDYERIITSISPIGAEYGELSYESDNPDVCTAAIGAVIAKAAGTAKITVKIIGTEISDSITVTVTEKTNEQEVKEKAVLKKIIPDESTVYMERYDSYRISYDLSPAECTDKIIFESANTSVATVDERGYVYAKKKGNTKIKLSSEDGKITSYVYVYVIEEDEDDYEDTSSIRSLYITSGDEDVSSKVKLMRTETLKLGIRTVPAKANKNVRWRSSNTKIATVSDSGVVTAVKEGTCKITATSKTGSSVSDSFELTITEYKRYPDKITVQPEQKEEFVTGKAIKFTTNIMPADTTEKKINWCVYGGNATIDQNGNVIANDNGKVRVMAYSSDYKVFGEYEFEVKYGENHFTQIGQAYNLSPFKALILTFDSVVNITGVYPYVFVCNDASGNGEIIPIRIEKNTNKIIVSGSEGWKPGTHYLFVKKWLCDQYGNQIGTNVKYEFSVRDIK